MIVIRNDGKEKCFSFEAWLYLEDGCGQSCLISYGATEQEAIEELKLKIETLKNSLTNVDFNEKIYVNGLGERIK